MTRQQLVELEEALERAASILEAARAEIQGPEPPRPGGPPGQASGRTAALVGQLRKAREAAARLCLPLLSDDDFAAVSARYRKLLMPPAAKA